MLFRSRFMEVIMGKREEGCYRLEELTFARDTDLLAFVDLLI